MSDEHDEQHDEEAPAPAREKPFWKMKPHERLEWTRRDREKQRFPVRPRDDNDNASGGEYDPFR